MVIYGVALLAACTLVGLWLGELLGVLIGVDANVGGVGIAMILLIVAGNALRQRGKLPPATERGVLFWSAIYIPVVVAMAAGQNVTAAVRGGPAALLAGVLAVAVGFALVPVLSRIGGTPPPPPADPATPGPGVGAVADGGAPMNALDVAGEVLASNGLLTAFAFVGLVVWGSYVASDRLTRGHVHGSALAILVGLVLAYVGGVATGGTRGLADVPMLAGIGVLGGAMIRDFAIIATAFGVHVDEIRRAGVGAVVALFVGVLASFAAGAAVAWGFGYRDPVSMTTIGAGAATYIVGPVTGTAIGATSDVMALSIAAGLVKSMLVMSATPFIAPYIGLDNPRSALVYGGLMGTTSGVAGGLAATDERLVPYGAMTATFYTGLGCLLGPSLIFVTIRALFG